jgi:hypothetical protein
MRAVAGRPRREDGSDEKRLGRTIVRINAIESTSPLASGENLDESTLPAALIPSEPEQPDTAYENQKPKIASARPSNRCPRASRRSSGSTTTRKPR